MTHEEIAQIARSCGFELETSEHLNEIGGDAYVMHHQASGARLLYLRNDDANKAFSISFKTPAANDTGVFHILEHSVLCGSRKFPVKEPFVNLLKTSMQTFLNAMTFPDKTMYPVASTNERDLMNLMDVYLDAVFYPDIYRKRTIFEQEGWHYELTGAPVGDAQEPPITFNGVVYNEMKGALSDADSVLYDELSAALFPDTTYRFESGGTPAAIPDLTYEAFLNTHERHYRPDNSYLMLYGDLDLKKFLTFIDGEYLAPLAEKFAGVPLDANPLAVQTAVEDARTVRRMATTPENASVALGYVIGEASERERIMATDILLDAIMGSNEAPLKRALLNAGLAADAVSFVYDAVLQPFVVLQLKGVAIEGADAEAACARTAADLRSIVEREVARLADGGLDHSLVESALTHAEFVMREHNFGYPDGVSYAMASMTGWLYADDLAVAYLRYEDTFESLRAQLSGGYFERLLRDVFLTNHHWAEAQLVPVEADEEAAQRKRLFAVVRDMTPADFERIEREVEMLRTVQEAPDDPRDLAKLPQLSVADIGQAPATGSFALDETGEVPLLRHELPTTHGIVYANRYYDLGGLTYDELPYARVLAMVLSHLDTAEHTAAQIDVLVQGKLGSLSIFTEVHERADDDEAFAAKLVVAAAALESQTEAVQSLVAEILHTTVFSDADRIRDMLLQRKVAMEQAAVNAGHSVAIARVASYCSRAALVREKLRGIDSYAFIVEMLEHYDERAEELGAKLAELAERIFTQAPLIVSFAGDQKAYDAYRTALDAEAREHRKEQNVPSDALAASVPTPKDEHEAFVVPSDVSFTAVGYDRRLLPAAPPYSGSLLLASRILSFDYLWNEVRVKGGAYGTGFQSTRSGSLRFYSYRDPHIDETVGRFEEAGRWLEEFDPSHSEMEGYVVSTVASLDAPEKPRDLVRRHDGMFFSGVTEQDRLRTRSEVIASQVDDVRALGPLVREVARQRKVCTVAGRDLVERSAIDFKVNEVFGG